MPDTVRTAIVTGGSGGIGGAIVERLAAAGFGVVCVVRGQPRARDAVVAAANDRGGRAWTFGVDLTDERETAALFDFAEGEPGGIDVIVNTAGLMILKPLAEYALKDFERLHAVNVRGTFLVSREAVRRVRRGGAIINFSTSVTKPALSTYTT